MTEVLLVENRGPVRVLTMNRPDKLNALNKALSQELVQAMHAADTDDGVAVVVLTGAGRAFSAGADLKEAQASPPANQREAIAWAERSNQLYGAIAQIQKPVIAAVKGYVLGGGCALTMSCDLVVAGESAVFGYPELKRGLAATAVAPTLVQQIGRKAAFELLVVCENVGPKRALELGMINRIVADDRIVDEAVAIGETIAAFGNDAVWMTKRVINRVPHLSAGDAQALARDAALIMRGFH